MSEAEIQEVANILKGKIDYQTINCLVDWIAQGEPLSDEERGTLRIRIIQMLCETAQWYGAYQALSKRDSMDFFHNQGYAGI